MADKVRRGGPVSTVLVGCGAVAQMLYRRPLNQLERRGILRVNALVDRHAGHAAALHGYFPGASVHEDLEEALERGPSELALILSPAQLHAQQAVLALRHDHHVLCEKPMATTSTQCDEVIAAAKEARRVLAVGMIRRFFPAFAQLRKLLVDGAVGDIRSFSYREGNVFAWDVKTPAGFTRHAGGGSGLLFDIGPHVVDYLSWLFGSLDVVSYADDALEGGVEGNVLLELETPVCPGSVQLSWDFPLKNELRVYGTAGEAVLRTDGFDRLAIGDAGGFEELAIDHTYPADLEEPARRRLTPRLYTEAIYCQLIQVARAIRLGEPPAVSCEDGRECVRVMASARRRAIPIDMTWLDRAQGDCYRTLHRANA